MVAVFLCLEGTLSGCDGDYNESHVRVFCVDVVDEVVVVCFHLCYVAGVLKVVSPHPDDRHLRPFHVRVLPSIEVYPEHFYGRAWCVVGGDTWMSEIFGHA